MGDKQTVMVGMSGGVDSSLSAALLLQQGHRVEGMFMKNWEEDDTDTVCQADEDVKDAQSVCDRLGIRLHRRNFSAEYWDYVFEDFLTEYRRGRTPNPDILCNREIKFKTFLDHADDLGAARMATGHYVRSRQTEHGWELLKGLDANKDQSYFLYTIGQAQLARSLFPLGELDKTEVRARALELGLSTHDKKDSTGICFIGEKRFQSFLAQYLTPKPGAILTPQGQTIGRHQGLMFYTIGQRQGLGIGGVRNAPPLPWFVAAKSHHNNALIAVQGGDHAALQSHSLHCVDLSWVAGQAPADAFECSAKVRYRQSDQPCLVRVNGATAEVEFVAPQRAVTPGQSIVFYAGDVCLGGGVIDLTDRLNQQCEFTS